MMACNCFMPEEEGQVYERVGSPEWPPLNPPSLVRHEGYKLIRGYLKRKSNKSDMQVKWVIRWMEVEPPDSERWDVMLAVYKTDLKQKRLNAVSLHNISSVDVNDDQPSSFNVAVGNSVYTLLARDEADASKWVSVLNENVAIARDGRENHIKPPPSRDESSSTCALS